MSNVEHLLEQIRLQPESVEFSDVIRVIEENYIYTPVRFTNGPVSGSSAEGITNDAGENEGSCKIFAFAKRHELTQEETLHCFGKYYRDDVLKNPGNNDHQNIRLFMKYGWQNIVFNDDALGR
jgi:hypothetical protein